MMLSCTCPERSGRMDTAQNSETVCESRCDASGRGVASAVGTRSTSTDAMRMAAPASLVMPRRMRVRGSTPGATPTR